MDPDKRKPEIAEAVNGPRNFEQLSGVASQIIWMLRNFVRSVIAGLPQ